MSEQTKLPDIIASECASCEKASICRVLARTERWVEDDPFPTRWTFVECEHCGHPMLFVQERDGTPPSGWYDPYRVWPSQGEHASWSIPGDVRSEFEEAKQAFKAKLYKASALMVRRTLEGVCLEQGAKKTDSLQKQLDSLKASGILEGRIVEWAHGLRYIGNAGAHFSSDPVSRQDAKDALDLGEAVLGYVYVFGEKYEEIKKRRGFGPKPSGTES
ncbi:DUF4145 domain-containing protein [Allorhizocola rhizosphaerae]|uniref:DUF4145 domain-containing protein n=1 Tax=Allorhizocola rhizosphaerae TaxID=1872709 RepID=UPI0013C30A5C|nr:DUF4145 domain-containing protein [Allorhizocola rhizosphaerae]